ncbi:MAG: Uma2 family endonuclease [Deltaproteobacteria bacterium]|nr:Uma2 family endonuclease [Deltaproteobacteria bacterium]
MRASFEDFEALLAIRGDVAVPRLHYFCGVLEIMSPSRKHERTKSFIGRLVEVFADEREIDLIALGSWTLRNSAVDRGAEPDECYQLGEKGDEAPPDLVIEVTLTKGGLEKLEIYAGLRVPEVWQWKEGRIGVHRLRGDRYEQLPASELMPDLDLALLERFLSDPNQAAAARAFRRALRSI